MRSAPSEPGSGRSLLLRVVGSTALTAAVGSAIAGLTGGLLTLNILDRREEEVQRIATLRFAQEIEEEETDGGETLRGALEDELGDLDYVGALGAIHRDGALLVGDAALSPQTPGTCGPVDVGETAYRSCTVSYGDRDVTLAVSAAHTRSIERLFGFATLGSIVFGVLTGLLLGRFTTRWALRPFESLGERVRRVKPDAPDTSVLEPPAEYREIEDLRRAVVDLVDRLGAALGHSQRFAGQASHELRTPLTAIAGELELLAESEGPVPTAALLPLRARVNAMTRLVERLLVLAVPPDVPTAEAVDLADVVDEALAELPEAGRARARVVTAEDVLVRGDATLLRMALSNAIENALKFSTGEVEVRIEGDDARAILEVKDDGPGIVEAERGRVFEPFYRSPSARKNRVGGFGIGLALIAHVVEGHGGEVAFREVSRGAALRITLPRWSVDGDAGAPA